MEKAVLACLGLPLLLALMPVRTAFAEPANPSPVLSQIGPCEKECPNGDHYHLTLIPVAGNKVTTRTEVWGQSPHTGLPRSTKDHTVPNSSNRTYTWLDIEMYPCNGASTWGQVTSCDEVCIDCTTTS